MIYKNTFSFATCVVTIGLGMGLLISGCGDGGSTTPNPLDGGDTPTPPTPEPPISDTYKVTFQYNSLAKNLGRIDVASDIVSVKYAFYGKADNKEFVTAPTKAHEFKHEASAQEQDITIDATEVEELGANIYAVTAAYYDESDNLVAVGYDKIDWQGGKTANVGSPDLYTIGNDDLSLTSYDPATGKNKTVFKPGENVGLSFELIPDGETTKTYDLTPFAIFSKLNDITDDKVAVLVVTQDNSNGQFTAAANGTVAPCATIDSAINYTFTEPIYVTEQTISGIKLSPVNSDLDLDEDKYFVMLSIAKKDAEGQDIPNAALGKETIIAEGMNTNCGVDKVPVQVTAIYTDDKKGPQPEDINITDEVKFTTEFDEGFTPAGRHESYLKVEDGIVIATNAVAEYPDQYKVTASYGDFTDSNRVTVYYVESELCFARDIDGNLSYVPESNPHQSLYWNMRVVGRFNMFVNNVAKYRSAPFFIDESLVGANEYPEAIANPALVQYTETFACAGNGSNKYLLELKQSPKTHELKVGDFKVDLPKFVPLQITSAY